MVGNITQIMANHTMVPESLTALLFQMPSAAFLAVKMTHLTKRYRERERAVNHCFVSVRVCLQGQGHSVVGCSFGQLGQGGELLKLL